MPPLLVDRYGRQIGRPAPPAWFSDTVELWAREWGRHATTTWEPAVGCFVTRFSRRAHDPVLQAVQAGHRQDDGEPYYWHEWSSKPVKLTPFGNMVPGYVAADLDQLGASGVRERLDRANLWGGRGEYRSLGDLADQVTAANEKQADAKRAQLKDGLRDPLRSTIRRARGNAWVGSSGTDTD
jgi:hypothetical protein